MRTERRRLKLLIIAFVSTVFTIQAQEAIRIMSFDVSECSNEGLMGNIRTRIIERSLVNQILTIKFGLRETCCVTFTPSIKYVLGKNNTIDTLSLDYHSGGDECECYCYYEFTYKVNGIRNVNVPILFKGKTVELSKEKYRTVPVKYRLLGNDTVNLVDKYGMRQGIWTFDTVNMKKYFFYKDDVHIRDVTLFDNGQIQKGMKREFGNWNYFVEYYESGEKKKECYNDEMGRSFRHGNCKEWNEKGDLVYEGPFKAEWENP